MEIANEKIKTKKGMPKNLSVLKQNFKLKE